MVKPVRGRRFYPALTDPPAPPAQPPNTSTPGRPAPGERVAGRFKKRQTGPRRWLVVMAKEPRCGAVKTRLARDIGAVSATQFYRHTLANVTARLAPDPRWRTVLAVSPDTSVDCAVWPRGTALIPQGPGDLGARMQRVFDCLPPGPVVIIGTDIPEISTRHIAKAFHALGSHDAVLGPCGDGGYWLVGIARTPRVLSLFENVHWSSKRTLADTLANLEGASIAMLEQLEDVDDGNSYRRLGAAGARLTPPVPHPAS